jgi:predicted kinase
MLLREITEMDNPEIIVMVGLPGSGKSTIINNTLAASEKEYVVVSSDDEIERLAKDQGLDYNSGFDQFIKPATAIMNQKFKDAIRDGKSVIWDQTNISDKKRASILSQVPSNYKKIAIVFEVDEAELNKRLSKREKETGKKIPPYVIKNMAASYVRPTKCEGFDEIIFA